MRRRPRLLVLCALLVGVGTWLGHTGSDALAKANAYVAEVEGLEVVGGDDEIGPLRREGGLRLGLGLALVTIGFAPLIKKRHPDPRPEPRTREQPPRGGQL